MSRSASSTTKKRRSSATPRSVTAIESRRSSPRLMTGAMSRWVTEGMARCYRTGRTGGVHPWSMLLGIDHLVIACADPDAAADDLARDLGLQPGGGGRHDALGTYNRLVWLGDTYLELIGVFDRDLASHSWVGAPTVRALEAGGGLATWAVATDDIDDDVTRLNAGGAGLSAAIEGERRRPDGTIVRWRLSAPRELGPERPPFLIEHDTDAAEWTAEDRATRGEMAHPIGGPARLTTLEIPVSDMPGTIATLMRTVRIGPFRPSLAGRGARDATVGGQTLRLRPFHPTDGQAWPIAVLHLVVDGAIEPRSVDVGGCRYLLRPTA